MSILPKYLRQYRKTMRLIAILGITNELLTWALAIWFIDKEKANRIANIAQKFKKHYDELKKIPA